MANDTWQDDAGRQYSRRCGYCNFVHSGEAQQCKVCDRNLQITSAVEDLAWCMPLVFGIFMGVVCIACAVGLFQSDAPALSLAPMGTWLLSLLVFRLIGCSHRNAELKRRRMGAQAKARMEAQKRSTEGSCHSADKYRC